jgi:hypothetical protein
LADKLKSALDEFGSRELKIIDIGVFPWHSKIEVSLLFTSEDAPVDDIAAWPNFDYSKMSEGGWKEAESIVREMNEEWEKDCDAMPFLMDFASAATSNKVNEVIKSFSLSDDFVLQILDPDDSDSDNFCA